MMGTETSQELEMRWKCLFYALCKYPTAKYQIPPSVYYRRCTNSALGDKDRLVVVPVAEGNTPDDSSP